MFKILIVDDEYRTRQGICNQVDFVTLGITDVEEADDGIHGLEKAMTFMPDIILSDIKMPRMDGIGFAFEVRKALPHCRLIFMSAYTELDYYRNAIKLGAINYIEKPLDLEELKAAIRNAISDLKQYRNMQSLKEEVDVLRENNQHVMMRQLSALMISRKINEAELVNKFKDLNLKLDPQSTYVTLLVKHIYKEHLDSYEQEEVKNRIDTYLFEVRETVDVGYVWHYKQDQVILNCWNKPGHKVRMSERNLMSLAKKLYLFLNNFCKPNISIGKVVEQMNEVYDSYARAVITNEKLFFKSGEMIEIYKHGGESKVLNFDLKDLMVFAGLLEKENKTGAILYAKGLYEQLINHQDTPINSVKEIYYRHRLEILKFSTSGNHNESDMILNDLNPMTSLSALDTYLCQSIHEFFHQRDAQNEKNNLTRSVERYINRNFKDCNMTIETMSQALGVTSSYLNVVFKKAIGITINKYLTQYRLNKAKEMLKEENHHHHSIAQIAMAVGYYDPDYFSRIFKKEVGCTATEYRKKFMI
ncbi:response regulator transcription factor [Petrocella sp. FN5]|uniref:response regulator transcription factor n=1 Tax=Petrocella sp. FN5 TaxID=3032002 RepID=UPI0023DCE6B3|nr:response regulator [Petrocella sp. FN5]MDF1615914.1 response regulator [Petrocella sp. FN5]